MEIKPQDDQPVTGYPVSTAGFGNPVIGYAVSQFQPPVPASTNANAAAEDAAAETTRININASGCNSIEKVIPLIKLVVIPLVFFFASMVMLLGVVWIPMSPLVRLTSVSATVRNASDVYSVTADLDVSFLVHNRAPKGMVFDHLAASACQAEAGPLVSFELSGKHDDKPSCNKTVLFRLSDVSFPVDAWEVIGKSGSLHVKFGLSANVTYKGKAWPKRRIPITVNCDSVKVPFSHNATDTQSQVRTVDFDEDSGFCWTDGLWRDRSSTFSVLGLVCFFMSIATAGKSSLSLSCARFFPP